MAWRSSSWACATSERLLFQALQARRRLAAVRRFAQLGQRFAQVRRMLPERLLIGLLVGGIGQHRGQYAAALQAGQFRGIGADLAGQVLLARRHIGGALQFAG